jgi:hypothetical protein
MGTGTPPVTRPSQDDFANKADLELIIVVSKEESFSPHLQPDCIVIFSFSVTFSPSQIGSLKAMCP